MEEYMFNSGIIEGLKIAKTYVVRECIKNKKTESKKFLRILLEINNAIQQEKFNISRQRSSDENE